MRYNAASSQSARNIAMSTTRTRNRRRTREVVAVGDRRGRAAAVDVRRDRRRHAPRMLLRRSARGRRSGPKKKKEGGGQERREAAVRNRVADRACRPSPKSPLPPVKPGHWATASQEMTANYRDFVGDSRLSIVDSQNRPYPVANTPFDVRASRPVLLTKGRPKVDRNDVLRSAGRAKRLISRRSSKSAAWASASAQPRTPLDADALVPVPLRGAGQGAVALLVHQDARFGESAVRRRIRRRRHRRPAFIYRVVATGRRPTRRAPR